MSPHVRRRVIWALVALVVALMLAGAAAAWLNRDNGFCSDGKAPVAQRDIGMGMISYRCSDGEIVRPGPGP